MDPESPPVPSRSPYAASPRVLFGVAVAVFVYLFVTHAWMVDDAYITLRTVDHFVHGRGLVWNTGERVQVYTHPLWMLLMCVPYAITHEGFYTILVLSLAVCVAMMVTLDRAFTRGTTPWAPAFLVALLVGSKAFMDWTSSGLENPLTNLLLVLFYGSFLFEPPEESRTAALAGRRNTWLLVLAGLSFVNRQDTILLFAPACAWLLVRDRARWRTHLARPLVIGVAAPLAWVLFATVYYGSPFPNTVYAKFSGVGLSASQVYGAGFLYYLKTLTGDPLTLVVVGLAIGLAIRTRRGREGSAALGIIAYLLYVFGVGAASTHMFGRFFSAPYVLAVLLCGALIREVVVAQAMVGLTALLVVIGPASTFRVGTPGYQLGGPGDWDVLDVRQMTSQEGSALIGFHIPQGMPYHPWYLAGLTYRSSPERVHVGGLVNGRAVGYCAYAAGPDKYFIDLLGLTDPLLARLPRAPGSVWNPGHVLRALPAGYVASIEHGDDRIVDPDLHAFYDAIRLITRGPIFSAARLGAIWRLNTGGYAPQVRAYVARHGS